MLVSLGLPVDRHGDPELLSAEGLARCAQAAEAAGFDAVFVTDHPAPDEAWLRHGGHPTLDPFVALSFVASATAALRLHTNLLVLPYRNPFLTAKSVASLDVLSGGRVIVGVGAGYLEPEFAALGVPVDERGSRTDDALTVLRAAWGGEPVDHDGPGYGARSTVVQPAPVQRPHPPIWVGGNSFAAMRRAVAHGQGWAPMPNPPSTEALLGTPSLGSVEALADRVRRLHELAEQAGRIAPLDVITIPHSLSGFARGHWEAGAVLEEIAALREAGATGLAVNLPGTAVGEFCDEVDAFAGQVLRAL